MTTLPPDHPRMRAWRLRQHAAALWEIGRFPEAARAAQESLAIEPDSARALCTLAQAQSGMGLTDEALASAEQACAADPKDTMCHRLRSIYLSRRGEHVMAVAAAQEAVRLRPESDMALAALSDAWAGAGDLAAAGAAALRICEIAPESIWAYERCGNIALAQGQYAEAEVYYRRGLALDPQHNVCLANLSWAMDGQGRRREAIGCLADVLRLHPSDRHIADVRRKLRSLVAGYLGDGGPDATGEAITPAERHVRRDALPDAVQHWYATYETP